MAKHPDKPIPSEEPTATLPGSGHQARVVGNYRLLQKIGEGGMGEVYEAEQEKPHRRVALKIIKRGMDTKQVVARFETERQALAMMIHPNIAKVHDAGETPRGRPFFAMEYVKGDRITAYCDKHRLRTRERLELFIQVCEGVQHAHQRAIIHRDLKPSNILVTVEEDGQPRPKIIDFGVAKATNQHLTERTLFTELGQLIGTPEYMSPEQAEMTGLDIDTRTDVYSLGVVLYELLTGALPFEPKELREAGLSEIQRKIREQEPPRPSTRVSTLGDSSSVAASNRRTDPAALTRQLMGDLDWITLKALDKDRTRRYESASALATDIRRHLGHQPVMARPPTTSYRVGRFVRRHRVGTVFAATVFLLLVGDAVMMMIQARRIAAERDRSEVARERAESEAQKATAINDFLQEMLASAGPHAGLGRDVTVVEVLAQAGSRIEETLGNTPEVKAAVQATLGATYGQLGDYEDAKSLLQSSLQTRRETLGDAHPDVAESLNLLAGVRRQMGDYEAAESLFREALAIRRTVFGNTHPDVAQSLNNLGLLLFNIGDYEGAEALLREAVTIWRKELGEVDLDVAAGLHNLALAVRKKGDFGEAERLFRDSLAIKRQILGDEHTLVATGMNQLASSLRDRGDYKTAEPLFQKAVAMYRRLLGDDHADLASGLRNYAHLLYARGDYEVAAPLYAEAGDILQRVLGPHHWLPAAARGGHGACLAKLGHYALAEELLLASHSALQEGLSTEHEKTREAAGRLAELYDAWGKPEKAAEYRAKLEEADQAN